MKKLIYVEGPLKVDMGAAGTFRRGEAKPVEDDDLAKRLLGKKSINFYEDGKVPADAMKRAAALVAAEAKAKEKLKTSSKTPAPSNAAAAKKEV